MQKVNIEKCLKHIISENGSCLKWTCDKCHFIKSGGCDVVSLSKNDTVKLSKKILRELKLERICKTKNL